jgi:hypothetical protein
MKLRQNILSRILITMYPENFYVYNKQNSLNRPSENVGTLWGWNLRVRIFWHKKFLVCTQQNMRTAKLEYFYVTTLVNKNDMYMHMADIDN